MNRKRPDAEMQGVDSRHPAPHPGPSEATEISVWATDGWQKHPGTLWIKPGYNFYQVPVTFSLESHRDHELCQLSLALQQPSSDLQWAQDHWGDAHAANLPPLPTDSWFHFAVARKGMGWVPFVKPCFVTWCVIHPEGWTPVQVCVSCCCW